MEVDIYGLADGRTPLTTGRFLNHFARNFVPAAAEYEFPRYADPPAEVFPTADGVMQRLYDQPSQPYGLYWTNPNRAALIASAMLFFTDDGGLIAGLAVRSEEQSVIRSHLAELARVVGAKYGIAMFGNPPPDSAAEFRQLVEETSAPKVAPAT